ncbi:hypothetical protein QBC44DRAFT_368438 [Cladorrhinum sp. PSN332]|nr:hypothetical protein QBC44DRAFT_368438 [Cladorrhinum sp. PSN332]
MGPSNSQEKAAQQNHDPHPENSDEQNAGPPLVNWVRPIRRPYQTPPAWLNAASPPNSVSPLSLASAGAVHYQQPAFSGFDYNSFPPFQTAYPAPLLQDIAHSPDLPAGHPPCLNPAASPSYPQGPIAGSAPGVRSLARGVQRPATEEITTNFTYPQTRATSEPTMQSLLGQSAPSQSAEPHSYQGNRQSSLPGDNTPGAIPAVTGGRSPVLPNGRPLGYRRQGRS